ncbi:MAG: hypothetical protein IPG38_01235 [Chitinophagaceae bacterium]|nr:hypothetical protein [Chitinophagaceae bacterium]
MELTFLTGTNINNWQDDVTTINESEIDATARYTALMPQVKADIENNETAPAGIILLGAAMLGAAGLMRWKGII